MKKKMWRILCKLPQGEVPFWNPRKQQIAQLLDEVEEILPVPNTGDKSVDLDNWISEAPLTSVEFDKVRWFITFLPR